jgi:hypothetical protein
MSGILTGSLLTAMLVLQPAVTASAQTANTPEKESSKELRLNGCISRDTKTPGQFNFRDADTGDRYRLTGKNLKKFVGQ